MSTQIVVGLFETRDAAEAAIRQLQVDGFRNENLGVALRDVRESGDLAAATGAEDLSDEGATAGAVSGAGVGALIGLALVGSSIVLPGLGTILIGGPLAAALAGAGIGAASGGLLGALIGVGIPEEDAEHYAGGLERGGILVSAQATDGRHVGAARFAMEEAGAIKTTIH